MSRSSFTRSRADRTDPLSANSVVETESLRVESGAVLVVRLYDVAYAIDLARVEALAATPVSRIRLAKAEPKAITFGVAPLEISLGQIELPLGALHTAETVARLYEFGVVSIGLRIPVRGIAWSAYVDLVNEAYRWASTDTGAAVFSDVLTRAHRLIEPALEKPTAEHLQEDYLIATVQKWQPALTAEQVFEGLDLVPLLSGEQKLATAARADLLRLRFSYYPTDLVVLTWDRAFVVEPSGDADAADVLEVANAQLLELRYYDDLLDAELPRMYDRVEEAHRGFRGLARRRYAHLARQLHALVGEITEMTERIDNALKVTEDVYLARIYGAAVELFRTRTWSNAVDRKLEIIRDTYAALYDDAATARAELLEMAIVLLIVFEIVWALLTGG